MGREEQGETKRREGANGRERKKIKKDEKSKTHKVVGMGIWCHGGATVMPASHTGVSEFESQLSSCWLSAQRPS